MNRPNETKSLLINSALWAAYGDALGFATELISRDEFARRNGGLDAISEPITFSKRVGGLFGPEVLFPKGAYSDDTQLRLSTSRAIRADGYFDVECFAKIELPVWLNYALGAGRGSKAAATNLSLRDTTWSQNFFKAGEAIYWEGGGNGAAMRIQPHAWKAHSGDSSDYATDVVRDAICTHGHPRGIAGAAIHAEFIYLTLRSGRVPAPADWEDIGHAAIQSAFDAIARDEELALVWIPNWERYTGRRFEDGWDEIFKEWTDAVRVAAKCALLGREEESYRKTLKELGGYSRAERGSGLKSALYSAILAWLFRDSAPDTAIRVSANEFGSDTDTIATMAGALIGLTTTIRPPAPVQDQDYIISEATRLFDIGTGARPKSFPYPELLKWTAPRVQSDAWSIVDGKPHLAGLGRLEPVGDVFTSAKGDLLWQWCKLEFGQTVLAKRKPRPAGTASDQTGRRREVDKGKSPLTPELPFNGEAVSDRVRIDSSLSIDEATQHCIRANFDPHLVGAYLMSFCEGLDGVEKAIAFSAILSKAKLARIRRS